MCFDSYKSESEEKKKPSNTHNRRRGNIKKKFYFFDDCRCNVEKSMRPPFLCVSSSGFVGIFSLPSVCLYYLFRWPRFDVVFFLPFLAIKIYVSMWKMIKRTPSASSKTTQEIWVGCENAFEMKHATWRKLRETFLQGI